MIGIAKLIPLFFTKQKGTSLSLGLHLLLLGAGLFIISNTFPILQKGTQHQPSFLTEASVMWTEPIASPKTNPTTPPLKTTSPSTTSPHPTTPPLANPVEPETTEADLNTSPKQVTQTTQEQPKPVAENQTVSPHPESSHQQNTENTATTNMPHPTQTTNGVDTPPNTQANYLNNPPPVYPTLSRRLREQGTVYLNACIQSTGQISELTLAKSSGYPRLDQSALDTVKHWRFIPAKRAGVAVDHCYQLPIRFFLQP